MEGILLTAVLAFIGWTAHEVYKIKTNCIPTMDKKLDKIMDRLEIED